MDLIRQSAGSHERDLYSLEQPGVLVTEASLAKIPATISVIPEQESELVVRIWNSVPMDPTGDTTMSAESTAVGG